MIRRAITASARLLISNTMLSTARFAVVVLLVACAAATTDRANAAAQTLHQATGSSNYSVGIERCTFVDHTRSVLNYAYHPPSLLSSNRTLITEIRYPTSAGSTNTAATIGALPAIRAGGFAMIVFVHGYNVDPSTYASLLNEWASRGFVVAAPVFPDENNAAVAQQHGANTEADLVNEPADIAFVTHQILADSSAMNKNCPILYGLIDSSALAMAGHSDGAIAAGMLSYSAGRDPQGTPYETLRSGLHFRATIIMEGDEGGRAPYRSSSEDPALLVIQSAQDHCNPARGALRLYRAVQQSNKWFLELLTAHHLPPFDGVDPRAFASVVATTNSFLQMSLDETSSAAQLLGVGNGQPFTARIFRDGPGPNIAPLTNLYCGLN